MALFQMEHQTLSGRGGAFSRASIVAQIHPVQSHIQVIFSPANGHIPLLKAVGGRRSHPIYVVLAGKLWGCPMALPRVTWSPVVRVVASA